MIKNWIGIIGNVGPEADEILQKYIRLEVKKRGALNDQDYFPMFVIKNPNISDRTEAIFHGGISPAIGIIETCKILEKNNVFYAALPSNTSHYFFDEFQSQTDVYIINLINITSEYVAQNGYKKIGILCTTPTKNTGIYTKSFNQYQIQTFYPIDEIQETCVQNAIYGTPIGLAHSERLPDGLKSGNREQAFEKISQAVISLKNQGCSSVLMGCTEIPTIADLLAERFPEIEFIDPMEILALKAIEIKEAVDKKLSLGISSSISLQNIKTIDDIATYVVGRIKL
jgi:aspartate racemase